MKAKNQLAGNTQPPPRTSFLQTIEQGLINKADGEDALEYIAEEAKLRSWKQGSTNRQYQSLKPFLVELQRQGLTLATLDKKATLGLIDWLQNGNDWAEDTRPSNWDRWYRFYRWAYLKHGKVWDAEVCKLIIGNPPFSHRWTYKRDMNKVIKKDIFSVEEMRQIICSEPELCYQAFFALTFEAGLRIGEALTLLVQDVRKTDLGFDIEIRQSKTEKRSVWVEKHFVGIIDKWMSLHPQRHNKDAKFFLNSIGQPLESKAANKRLKERAAKLFPHKKKVSVHSLRHSWATEAAGYMNEMQMRIFFGWASNSDMPSTYVRTQKVDVRRVMRQAHGIEQTAITDDVGKPCPQCSYMNPRSLNYCNECASPLDLKEFMARKEKDEATKIMAQALMDKDTLTKMQKAIEQITKELRQQQTT